MNDGIVYNYSSMLVYIFVSPEVFRIKISGINWSETIKFEAKSEHDLLPRDLLSDLERDLQKLFEKSK